MNNLPATIDKGSKRLKNTRHEAFCIAYTGKYRHNAARSYVEAGYKVKDMLSAAANSDRLFKIQAIVDRIEYLNDRALQREMLHTRDAVSRLRKIATAKISDFLDKNGNIDLKKIADPELSEAIQEVIIDDTKYGQRIRIKLKDDMRALELLGLTDKVDETQMQNNFFIIER